MKDIIIATKNSGKAQEFKTLFASYDIQARSLSELSQHIADVKETGSTFAENAELKARQIADILNQPVIADDSGIVIDALNGRPGVFSARYAGEQKDDEQNINKVLGELYGVKMADRTARFVCVLAVAVPGREIVFKTGVCEGKITYEPIGFNGFGYDPIFIPNGYTQTMAELSAEEKNQISHRSKAIEKLQEWLESYA